MLIHQAPLHSSPNQVRSEGGKELVRFEGWPTILTPSLPPQILCEKYRNNDFRLTQGIHVRHGLHRAEAGGTSEGIFLETIQIRGRLTIKACFSLTIKQKFADLYEAGPLGFFFQTLVHDSKKQIVGSKSPPVAEHLTTSFSTPNTPNRPFIC